MTRIQSLIIYYALWIDAFVQRHWHIAFPRTESELQNLRRELNSIRYMQAIYGSRLDRQSVYLDRFFHDAFTDDWYAGKAYRWSAFRNRNRASN